MKIDVLPDVALLEIFDFCLGKKVHDLDVDEREMHSWCTLAHVCRKWRDLVLGSPRRLGIRLWYKANQPLQGMLDIWPPLPIAIWANPQFMRGGHDNDDIVAALDSGLNDRIYRIQLLDFPSWQLEDVLEAMHQPFPLLSVLGLGHYHEDEDEIESVIPDSFLGGSAPHIQTLYLDHIPFPGLPKLLLSATHLVNLSLRRIPHSVYFPPEVLVDCLSVLTRLEILNFDFESPRSRVDQISPLVPPPTRTLVPVLTELWFRGLDKYLEDLVARIDAPLLDKLEIFFLHEPILDNSQLTKFIGRTPKLKARNEARLVIFDREVWVALQLPQTPTRSLKLGISYKHSDLQLLPLAQVCSLSFPEGFIPAVEHLNIIWDEGYGPQDSDVIENNQWLALLRPFTGVKSLYISRVAVPRIALVLQELVGERVTEVLPALETLSLYETTSGPVQEGIAEFVSARQVAGHPITISYCAPYIGRYW